MSKLLLLLDQCLLAGKSHQMRPALRNCGANNASRTPAGNTDATPRRIETKRHRRQINVSLVITECWDNTASVQKVQETLSSVNSASRRSLTVCAVTSRERADAAVADDDDDDDQISMTTQRDQTYLSQLWQFNLKCNFLIIRIRHGPQKRNNRHRQPKIRHTRR